MALIKCPECGSQISDKATICPNCGCDPQKVLAEIREKQRLQQKKRRKRIIISISSVVIVSAIAVLTYLYSIDGLNSIPSDYRKATENTFEQCESAIDKGDFDKGTVLLDALGKRTLTNRQAKRFEKTKIAMLEMGLNGIENTIAAITNNSNIPDSKVMGHIKKNLADFKAYQLDASQTERLKKAKENYIELQLGKMENMLGLYEADTRLLHYYNEINRVAQDVRELELSSTQKTRVENAIRDAERIKNQEEASRKKQKDAEAIAFIEKFYSYALGKNATGWTDAVLEQYLGPAVLKYLSEDFGEIITSPLLYCDPVGDYDFVGCTKAVAMEDGRYRKDFTSKFYFDSSKIYGSIFYTVETINGKMRITKIELVSRDD